jgi:hypothetical protein
MKQQCKSSSNCNKNLTNAHNKCSSTMNDKNSSSKNEKTQLEKKNEDKDIKSGNVQILNNIPDSTNHGTMPIDLYIDLMESINFQNDEKTVEICKLSIF